MGGPITSKSIAHAPVAGDPVGRTLVTLDGRYHIVERIAAGGMGEVFLAHDAVLAREVAVKVLHRSLAGDQGFVDRFRREARAAATLNHPNIVAVYDWGSVDGIYYMVMEHVRGRGVRDLLNAMVRLEPAQAADIVRQTLLALEHAHDKGIVHRDIKPENMLVNAGGVLKLTDMGLARAYADGRATQAGTVTGTVQYLAPEQIRGEPADPRTDLYSLGVVTFELLTGRLPFTGETAMAIAYKHLSDRVPAPSSVVAEVATDLDGFVASATERDRELRPESAREMRRDLEAIARDLPAARPLAALVADAPEVVDVRSPKAEEARRATTVTIPRSERHRRRGLRRFFGVLFAIVALAAAAWGAWNYLLPHRADVPAVAGLSVQEATNRLTDAGFRVEIGEAVYSLDVPKGDVVRTRPAATATLDQGATVTLVPSLGPRPVDVPAVKGKRVEQARQILTAEGLQVASRVERRYSAQVPEGRVIATDPASGAHAHEGDEVGLIVSKGPPPVQIPPVVGLGEDAAKKQLGDLGFRVTVETRYSDQVQAGFVISQDPEPPAEQPQGSTVTIVVSLGPKSFAVDSYLGLTKNAAIAAIHAAGLEARVDNVPGGVAGLVVGQTPSPGTTVHAGDTITIFVA
jgi:beta-lactam-binding protein with PASTA domain